MGRFPRGIDAAYLDHMYRERMERLLSIEVRYQCGEHMHETHVIIDRDPGDEDPGVETE